MGAPPGQRIEVERQGGDEGLSLTSGHLGDLPLMQHHAADQLHVVGHHVPDQLVPGHLDRGAEQATAGLTNGGKDLRQQLVEPGGQLLLIAPFQVVEAALENVSLDRIGATVLGLADLLELGPQFTGTLRQPLAKATGLSLEIRFAQVLELLLAFVDLVHDRLDLLALPVEPGAEDRRHQWLNHSGSKYNRCVAMYSATASGTQ